MASKSLSVAAVVLLQGPWGECILFHPSILRTWPGPGLCTPEKGRVGRGWAHSPLGFVHGKFIMLCERNQTQKATYYMLLHV